MQNNQNPNNTNDPPRIRDQDQLRVREAFFMFLSRYLDLLKDDSVTEQLELIHDQQQRQQQQQQNNNGMMYHQNNNNQQQFNLSPQQQQLLRAISEAEYYQEQLERLSKESEWSTVIVDWTDFVNFDEII